MEHRCVRGVGPLVGTLLALGPSHALAADVRGTLDGVDALAPATPVEVPPTSRTSYWEEPNGALDVRHPRLTAEHDAAVILTGPNVADASRPVVLPVRGGRCVPGTVVIAPTTTLRVQNLDWTAHEFFVVHAGGSTEPLGNFLPDSTAPRSERQGTIGSAGLFELRDRLQPTFRCWLVVGDGQGQVATVAHDNTYRLTGVADGAYTLGVYIEGRKLAEVPVRVAAEHETVVPVTHLASAAPTTGAAATDHAAPPPAHPPAAPTPNTAAPAAGGH